MRARRLTAGSNIGLSFAAFLWTVLLTSGIPASAQSAPYRDLPVVKPAMPCEQLAGADMSRFTDAHVAIKTAAIRQTDKGPYCRVTGSTDFGIGFAGDLPVEHWTQRFLQGAQGREGIAHAGSCQPALNGEIAVVTEAGDENLNTPGNRWGNTPQTRINSAYMGQHMTAVAFKDVIRAYYGQAPKYSYMVGCSGGGGQTMIEAQRFPADFDGFSIGAPPIYDTVHNTGFWHGWEYHVNQRPDGSIILTKDKLPILHEAAIAHCAAVSGTIDGGLEQPTACTFNKAWVTCPADATDTSRCLTPEEANVAEQLYLGPNDGTHFFEISGYPLGSELQWRLSSPGKPADGEGLSPNKIHSVLMPPVSGETTAEIMSTFTFTQDWFDKTLQMAPLFNITNTNLRPLAKRGDKIILYIGAEDNVVQPAVAISYYEGVQKELGAKETDKFLRFFLLPGMGHCGMGDGANQVDILGPLMAWVEEGKAPVLLVAGRPAGPGNGPGGGGPGGPGGGGPGGPGGGPGGPGGPGAMARTGPPNYPPYAELDKATTYTRPVFQFPNVAVYKGSGDPNMAANYKQEKGPLKVPEAFPNETAGLIGPNNQKFYVSEGDNLVEAPKP